MSSNISQGLIDAYQTTDFRVGNGSEHFTLRIGLPCEALKELYASREQSSALFITAFNPCSKQQEDDLNQAAQRSLLAELRTRTPDLIHGEGVSSIGDWPGEPSWLALGLTLEESKRLGTRFGQNAVVWAAEDAVPLLILLR